MPTMASFEIGVSGFSTKSVIRSPSLTTTPKRLGSSTVITQITASEVNGAMWSIVNSVSANTMTHSSARNSLASLTA